MLHLLHKGETSRARHTSAGTVEGGRRAELLTSTTVASVAALPCSKVTLADLIAPDAVDLARDHLRMDGAYARTLIVTGYPRTVVQGWLDPLLTANETLDVSLHLCPQDSGDVQVQLSHAMVQLQSSRLAGAKAGRLDDAEMEVAYADCEDLRDRLQRGDERVLTASLSITVYGTTLYDLEARTVRIERLLGMLMVQTRRTTWQALAGLRSTLPMATAALHSRGTARTLDTGTLATMFPFSGAHMSMDGGVLYGLNTENNSLVVVDGFSPSLFNYNQCVVATSGAGKSYTVKLILLRSLPLGVQTLVIDPVGEYVRLATALGGQVLRLSAGSSVRINPLALPPRPAAGDRDEDGEDDIDAGWDAGDEVRDLLKEHVATVHGLFDILLAGEQHRLTPQEKGALDEALRRCYARRGITSDLATHRRPAPTFADLWTALDAAGDPQGLASRLAPYCGDGSLSSLFSGATTVTLDGRLIVFDLSRLEQELRSAAMYLIGQYIWGMAARDTGRLPRRPRRLIIDEAQLLTSHPAGGQLVENCARRGRRHFLGVTAISQDARDFLTTKPGQALLTNSSTRILLRQDESTLEALEAGLRLTPSERSYLLTCPRGEALLCVQGMRAKVRMDASPLEHQLCTTDPHEACA